MAKKSKRERAKFKYQQSIRQQQQQREQQNLKAASPVQSAPKPATPEIRPFTPSARTQAIPWQDQYKYIIPELTRIGIIAVVFLVIIIILSFLPLDKIFFK